MCLKFQKLEIFGKTGLEFSIEGLKIPVSLLAFFKRFENPAYNAVVKYRYRQYD